ncbi:MAG TPA: YbaK/EbsC family protein [Candidatus Nanopelagicaceae bacterium]|nr:YbaK/EbsC family protein [Candidatus Nanopelagicaceae bacterium]
MATHEHPAVLRVQAALHGRGLDPQIAHLDDSARTAIDAAKALGIEVGQVASSIVFGLPGDPEPTPLLVITSGRHRVDTHLVAEFLNIEKILRADADFVRKWSGFAIGGVSPLAWKSEGSHHQSHLGYPSELRILIDLALSDYEILWAAAGHTHAVFQTNFAQLIELTGATPVFVGA